MLEVTKPLRGLRVFDRLYTLQIRRFRTISHVKCTLVQALRLCTGRTVHRGSSRIALSFHDHGTRRGWGVSVMPRPLFTPGKDPVPILQEAGWARGAVWTGSENIAPTGIRSPDRPVRSQSLYRLSYPAHISHVLNLLMQKAVFMSTQKSVFISVHIRYLTFLIMA